MQIFFNGVLLQASLILTLGAQNLFLIDVGVRRNNQYLAAVICALCDVLLIFLGIFSVSEFIAASPLFKAVIGMVGAIFLLSFGFMKLSEAYSGACIGNITEKGTTSRRQLVLATLGFTLLNPHVYLETVFVIGGISTQYSSQADKVMFGVGAGFFSIVWFFFLATFSSRFSKILSEKRGMRIVSFLTGLVLGYLAIKLFSESYTEALIIFK